MFGRLFVVWLPLLCTLCLTSSVSPWHFLHTQISSLPFSPQKSYLSSSIQLFIYTNSIAATDLHTVYRYSAASLVCRESYRISRATHRKTLSQKRKRSKDVCSCFCNMYITEKSKTKVQLAGEKQNQWR